MHDEFIKRVLQLHRDEWPFKVGRDSKNRRRYYWLSGVLHSVADQMAKAEIPDESPPNTSGMDPVGECPTKS